MASKEGSFLDFLEATRIYRVFPTLMIVLVSASFAEFLNFELILFGFVGFLIYAANGLYNSIKDGDHNLPDYSKNVVLFLIFFALIVSFFDKIIFLTAFISVILGFMYNSASRFFVLLDTTLLSLTHYTIPFFSSLLLVGFNFGESLKFSLFMFSIFWFFTPSKNLKGVEQDRVRGYKTLPIVLRSGKFLTLLMFIFSAFLMAFSLYFFSLNFMFLFFLYLIFILYFFSLNSFWKGENVLALFISRMIILFFLFGIIFSKTTDLTIIFSGLFFLFFYPLLFLINRFRRRT